MTLYTHCAFVLRRVTFLKRDWRYFKELRACFRVLVLLFHFSMFTYTYDAAVVTGDGSVVLRPLTPQTKRFSPDDSAGADALEWWQRLKSAAGIPLREYVGFGVGENNTRTTEMFAELGLHWRVSYVPREFWRASSLASARQIQAALQLERLGDVLQASESLRGLRLHDYQEEGVAFVLAMMELGERGSILADEMGLGKTLQALVVVACLAAECPRTRVLVVCPGFLRFNWQMEMTKWGVVSASPQIMRKGTDRPDLSEDAVFVVASYEWLRTVMRVGERGVGGECLRGFDLVVFDEAHFLKTMSGSVARCSKRNRAATKLLERLDPPVKHALFLTGTPTPNYTKELYALLRLTGSLDMSYPEFAFRYCDRKFSYKINSWDDKGVSAASELVALQTHMIRRLAKDHLELPEEMNLFVNLKNCGSRAMRALQKRREQYATELNDSSLTEERRSSVAAKLRNLRSEQLRECGRSKRLEVAKYLRQYLEDYPGARATPVIVFAYHDFMYEALRNTLESLPRNLRVPYAIVNGETSDADKEKSMADFAAGRIRVYVLSLAMTNGLNMQRADTCIFTELRFSPGDMRQAMTRICRQGSPHAQVKHVWLFGGDVDREVYDGLVRKEARMNPALKREFDQTDEGAAFAKRRK